MDVRHGPDTAVPNPIKSTALSRPRHPVLIDEGEIWSAHGLYEAVVERAGQMASAGVRSGHLVALVSSQNLSWIRDFHAIGWIGAAVAPLDPSSSTQSLDRQLAILEPDHIVDDDFLRSQEIAKVPERFWPMEETRLVMLTSGTTGSPKTVRLTTSQLLFSAFGSATRIGLDPADRWLTCLPLHHIGGLSTLVRSAWYGTSVVLQLPFDATQTMRLIDEEKVSLISLVPTMLERILDIRANRPFPNTLRAVLLGGAAAKASLLNRCASLGIPLATTWGMTETASQIATAFPGEINLDGFVGPPLPFARVHAKEGALHISGPVAGEVLASNDRGMINERGEIRVDGRLDDVIISGGENIDPLEMELALSDHPAVAAAGVVGLPDATWGEKIVAALVLQDGAKQPLDEEILTWCRERIGAHHFPREVHWRKRLPLNTMGKIARDILRKDLCT